LQITVHTRLDLSGDRQPLAVVLDDYSSLMNRVERTIHAKLQAGRKWRGDLAVSLYKDFGISAKLIESAYDSQQGKVKAAFELAQLNAENVSDRVKKKQKQIDDKNKKLENADLKLDKAIDAVAKLEPKIDVLKQKLDDAKSSGYAKALQRLKSALGTYHSKKQEISEILAQKRRLKRELNQHKRKLNIEQHRLKVALERVENPSICFGTKKLFKSQYNLAKNGFASHAEWKAAWEMSRSSTFLIEGLASAQAGNEFAKLMPRPDGLFDLELRLPEALKHHARETKQKFGKDFHLVKFEGLSFSHNVDLLNEALCGNTSVAVRFRRDEKGWTVYASFKIVRQRMVEDYSCGAIAVDLNSGFVSVARLDRFGNKVETFDIPMVTYGKRHGQSEAIIKEVASEIAAYAVKHHSLPIASELLDFQEKKQSLKDKSPRFARMLSSFVYSAFDAALASACARNNIYHRRVNPAYTSIIGRTKFASRYGLSVHASAAIAIARRAMKLSERIPLSFNERAITLPLNDAHHVTLELPARKDTDQLQSDRTRHVWSDWRRVNQQFRGALAARRPSRQKPRSTLVGRNDLHSMVCRRRKDVLKVSTQSLNQRVGSVAVLSALA